MNEMMTRREMLKLSGLTALAIGAVISGGLGARAATAGVFSAGEGLPYEAWQSLQPGAEPRTLVAAAVLAANPHNTQPWRFRLSSAGIVAMADESRALPAFDPTGSEMVAGLGCAIENISVAAAVAGMATRLEVVSAGGPLTAQVALSPAESPEGADLYAAIPQRHTNRGPYSTERQVPTETLAQAEARLGTLSRVRLSWLEGGACDRFGTLVNDATAVIIADRGQSEESDRWWRAGRDDLERYRDGLTLDAQGPPATTVFVAKILPRTSRTQNDQTWLKNTREVHVKTASAFGLLSVQDAADPLGRLEVGRAYQRLHLWATLHGLAMHPMNQVTERIYRDRSLGTEPAFAPKLAELTPAGRTALFAFRIGFPEVEPGISPRRRLEDVIDG